MTTNPINVPRDLFERILAKCPLNKLGDDYQKAWEILAAPQPSDDAKDAARYRWLEFNIPVGFDNAPSSWDAVLRIKNDNAEHYMLSQIIDAAMGSKGDE